MLSFLCFVWALVAQDLSIHVSHTEIAEECWVLVDVEVPPEHHIYWKQTDTPGMATNLSFETPKGVSIKKIFWSTPQPQEGYAVYANNAKILCCFALTQPSLKMLKAKLHYVLCGPNTCASETKDIVIDLQGKATLSQETLKDALAITPQQSLPTPITIKAQDNVLELHFKTPQTKPQGVFFWPDDALPLTDQQWESGKVTLKLSSGIPVAHLRGLLQFQYSDRTETYLIDNDVVFPQSLWCSIWFPLLMAVVGGFLLNFMPCVLPVLAVKLLSLVEHTQYMKWKSLFFAIGMITTFKIFALLLIVFKLLGYQMGWGFQMQSPAFIYILCVIFTGVALNLFGVFNVGAVFTRLGGTPHRSTRYFYAFVHGMLTSLVATPCSAPYMGIALGYALSQPVIVVWLIFSALGLGMALPFVVLPFVPGVVQWLPQPGYWMVTLKHIVGFCVLGTVLWLMRILGALTNLDTQMWMGLGLLVVAIGLWLWNERKHIVTTCISLSLIGAALMFGFYQIDRYYKESIALSYEPFQAERLTQLTQGNHPVLLRFTADWCITCHLNDKVFQSPVVIQKLKEKNVTVMVADLTSRSEAIIEALARYERQSIPFTVLHTGKTTHILPEILSEARVLEYLEKI